MSENICGFAGREAFLPNFLGPLAGAPPGAKSKCLIRLERLQTVLTVLIDYP